MSPFSTYDMAGFLIFGFMFGVFLTTLISIAVKEFRKRKRPTASRTIKANPTEFEKIGNWAISHQRMVSLIYQTSQGDYQEVIKE